MKIIEVCGIIKKREKREKKEKIIKLIYMY
jgi:hypothetical protein